MSLTRRLFLHNAAAAGAIASAPVLAEATEIATGESPALIDAWKTFRAAETEKKAAKDALEWLADEWRHLWPLAPEAILGNAGAHNQDLLYGRTIEQDILGRPLMRDCAPLTKRLPARWRSANERTCFETHTAAEIRNGIRMRRESPDSSRSERSRARNKARREEWIKGREAMLPLAEQYEAETARIRKLSGVEAAKRRIERANEALDVALEAVFAERPRSLYGARLQADALCFYLEDMRLGPKSPGFLGAVFKLTDAVLEQTAHLDARWKSASAPRAA